MAGQYDAMAADYARDNEESPWNAYYERPAMCRLVGDVRGKRVLDAGCGAGAFTQWLADAGGTVTAFDASPAMVDLAEERVGGRAEILVANLEEPLWFLNDAAFDLIVSSLVLHYVEDWGAVLREFRRVLGPDGSVFFSTHHPTMDWMIASSDDYFSVKRTTEVWTKGSSQYEVSFWRRPLTAMSEEIAAAGFVIQRVVEPMPLPELESRDLDAYRRLTTQPRYLFFHLKAA